jgi:hypothetical protein
MNTLFSIDPVSKDKPANRCKHCVHMYEHQYNSSMKYCGKQKGRNTSYGLKKIKANDPACPMFEKIIKQP